MAIEIQGPVLMNALEAVVSSSCALVETRTTVLGQICARCCMNIGWEMTSVPRGSLSKGQDQ